MLLLTTVVSGCSKPADDRIKTYPITGEIVVDGKPAASLPITLHRVNGIDPQHPTVSSAMTDENGKFSVSTYEANDGAPVGEYILTFSWGELNRLSMQYEGDKLKGRYSTPETSKFRVKVEDKPIDMGKIELTTK